MRASVRFALSLYGLTSLICVKELNVSFYLTSGNGHNTEIFRFYVPNKRLLHQVIFSFIKASQATRSGSSICCWSISFFSYKSSRSWQTPVHTRKIPQNGGLLVGLSLNWSLKESGFKNKIVCFPSSSLKYKSQAADIGTCSLSCRVGFPGFTFCFLT